MRHFRAQRNFYIAGWVLLIGLYRDCYPPSLARFALFLLLVIKQLVSLISANAGLQVKLELIFKHIAPDHLRPLKQQQLKELLQVQLRLPLEIGTVQS